MSFFKHRKHFTKVFEHPALYFLRINDVNKSKILEVQSSLYTLNDIGDFLPNGVVVRKNIKIYGHDE